jgi:hypothetical protein
MTTQCPIFFASVNCQKIGYSKEKMREGMVDGLSGLKSPDCTRVALARSLAQAEALKRLEQFLDEVVTVPLCAIGNAMRDNQACVVEGVPRLVGTTCHG